MVDTEATAHGAKMLYRREKNLDSKCCSLRLQFFRQFSSAHHLDNALFNVVRRRGEREERARKMSGRREENSIFLGEERKQNQQQLKQNHRIKCPQTHFGVFSVVKKSDVEVAAEKKLFARESQQKINPHRRGGRGISSAENDKFKCK
jgi:hypothetical protein